MQLWVMQLGLAAWYDKTFALGWLPPDWLTAWCDKTLAAQNIAWCLMQSDASPRPAHCLAQPTG